MLKNLPGDRPVIVSMGFLHDTETGHGGRFEKGAALIRSQLLHRV